MQMQFSPEVAEARANGIAIVALESTIITHGMPFPQNVETARAVEADIRKSGAVPATIAVLGGVLHIGLTEAELDHLAKAEDVMKLSRADIASGIAQGPDQPSPARPSREPRDAHQEPLCRTPSRDHRMATRPARTPRTDVRHAPYLGARGRKTAGVWPGVDGCVGHGGLPFGKARREGPKILEFW